MVASSIFNKLPFTQDEVPIGTLFINKLPKKNISYHYLFLSNPQIEYTTFAYQTLVSVFHNNTFIYAEILWIQMKEILVAYEPEEEIISICVDGSCYRIIPLTEHDFVSKIACRKNIFGNIIL